MTVTTLPAATLIAHINACNTNLQFYGGQLAPERSQLYLIRLHLLPSNLSLGSSATSTPLIPPYDNPSFETGTLGSWTEIPPKTPNNLIGSITTEQSYSGQHSLKLQYNNLADDFIGWEHRVRFEPGARYEFSFWYYSLSNQSRGTLFLKVEYPGTSLPLVVQMANQGTGEVDPAEVYAHAGDFFWYRLGYVYSYEGECKGEYGLC
ncbi:hypothetical protein P885DRAFT_77166 [Corynascus similis CBS 632.67]